MEDVTEMKFLHKGSLGDEDDAWMSNTRIVKRKRAMLHLMMKHVLFMTLDHDVQWAKIWLMAYSMSTVVTPYEGTL